MEHGMDQSKQEEAGTPPGDFEKNILNVCFTFIFFLKLIIITEDKRKTMLMLISADAEIFILL